MNTRNIVIISIISILLLICVTAITARIKPQMHKKIMLENIIFKRSTK